MDNMGQHAMLDAYLSEQVLDAELVQACELAIRQSGMHVECCTKKAFSPQGTTMVWILSESHFTLHTYPEHGYFSVDCYTCGTEGNPMASMEALLRILPVKAYRLQQLKRGTAEA